MPAHDQPKARPANSFIHVLDDRASICGYSPRPSNRFEYEPVYRIGQETLTETALLLAGWAVYRVQIDRFTVRDYTA